MTGENEEARKQTQRNKRSFGPSRLEHEDIYNGSLVGLVGWLNPSPTPQRPLRVAPSQDKD